MVKRLEALEGENRELREAVAPVLDVGGALEVSDPPRSAPTGTAPTQTLWTV